MPVILVGKMRDFIKHFLFSEFQSEYSHDNRIDIVDGVQKFYMDCSGFIYWCLNQSGYKRALVEARIFLRNNNFIKINRLFCKDFAFISQHSDDFKYWDFVNAPIQNCILVIVFPDGNGHCMFVDEIIASDNNGWNLRVVDSTQFPHQNDSRNGKTGIGIGEIRIDKSYSEYVYDAKNKDIAPRVANVYFVVPKK